MSVNPRRKYAVIFVLLMASSIVSVSRVHAADTTAARQDKLIKDAVKRTEGERSAYGEKSPRYIRQLVQLGSMYTAFGRYREAEKFLRAALGTMQSCPPEEVLELDLADVRAALALTLYDQGKLDEAQTLFKEVLAIQLRMEPRDDLAVFTNLSCLADIYKKKGDLPSAEKCYRRIVDTVLKRRDNLQARKHTYAYFGIQLASVLWEEGHRIEASKLADQVCDALLNDREYHYLATVFEEVYPSMIESKKQEQLYRKIMSVYEMRGGKSSTEIANYTVAAVLLSNLLVAQNRYEEDVQQIDHVLAKRKQVGISEQSCEIELLVQGARSCSKLKQYDRAKQFAVQARKIAAKYHNLERTAGTSLLLGEILMTLRDFQACERSLLEATTNYSKIRGSEIDFAICLRQLGRLFLFRRNFNRAKTYFEHAVTVVQTQFGPKSTELADCLESIGNDYKDFEPNLAHDYWVRAQESRKNNGAAR